MNSESEHVDTSKQMILKGGCMEQVNRASEEMMRSQTVISDVSSSPSPLMSDRSEQLDVERLNKLIRTFDKSWILPRSGSREPVGSNFQVRSKYFIE